MRRLWLCLALAGCGRLEFGILTDADIDTVTDASIDVSLVGHDEDGDLIDDAVDLCPHIPSPTPDNDSDGIGDACDPEPLTPTEQPPLFWTLRPGDHPFDDLTGFVQEADALSTPIGGASLRITRPITTARIEVGFDIRDVAATGQRQVATGIESGVEPFYFVELNENQPTANVAVVSYDATNGYVTLVAQNHLGVHTGRGYQWLDVDANTPPRFDVATGWFGEPYTAAAATPAYAGGTAIRFTFNGVELALEYVRIVPAL